MSNNWADLPEELLHLVLANLFAAKDRHMFSLVCRCWNAITKDVPYRYSPGLLWFQKSDPPLILFQHNGLYSPKYRQILDGAHIRCAKYGWLLLSHSDETLSLFDPFNERKFHYLPKCDYPYTTMCFFNKPTSSECFVIGIMNTSRDNYPREVQIGVLNLNHGDDKWKSYLCYSEVGHTLSACSPILHRGSLFCLDLKGNLYMNQLGNELSWNVVNTNCPLPPGTPLDGFAQQFLIKLEEEHALLAVLVAYDERKVNVYKMNIEEELPKLKEWEPVGDLSNKALFVSINASFAVTVVSPPLKWMANKIFFPERNKLGDLKGTTGVFYSLNTKKYHLYESNYRSDTCHNLKVKHWAAWILPEPTPGITTLPLGIYY